MDGHFRVLGLTRGCDEAALKRAYHVKALALHPDRNPAGAEQFKKVNEAYEALRNHFRRGGGRDLAPAQTAAAAGGGGGGGGAGKSTVDGKATFFTYTTYQTNSGSGYQYAKWSQFKEEPPHLFTEEELFGAPPGGFAHERRNARGRTHASPEANSKTGTDGTKNGNSTSEFNRGPRTGAQFNASQVYEKANERWRRAHGDRVPVSGYSMQGGGTASRPFHQQQRQQQQQQQRRQQQSSSSSSNPAPFSSSFAADVTGDTESTQNRSGARGCSNNNKNGSNGFSANGVGRNKGVKRHPRGGVTVSDDDDSSSSLLSSSSSSPGNASPLDDVLNVFETQETLREVRREWERLKRDTDRKMPKSTRSPNETSWGKWGAGGDTDEDYVIHSKPARPCEDDATRYRRQEQQRLNEAHMRGLLEEKLKLKRVLFTQRYTPDPADVALMSDSEVFVLCDLLRDVGQRMQQVFKGRLTKGLCSRCSSASKMQEGSVFTCGHTSVCAGCATTCGICPVCAATRR